MTSFLRAAINAETPHRPPVVTLEVAIRPRWRHWHVEGRDFGYTLQQARAIAAADAAYYRDRVGIQRCDIDHSTEGSV